MYIAVHVYSVLVLNTTRVLHTLGSLYFVQTFQSGSNTANHICDAARKQYLVVDIV